MKVMKYFLVFYCIVSQLSNLFSQSDSSKLEKQKIKTGFSFGGVPAVAYDSDQGFRYGLILNVFHFGDGSNYPNYKHSLYLEWSRTTKGGGTNNIIYDSKFLIPNVRFSSELSYNTEQALDFYGINGYRAFYNSDLEDQEKPGINHSRMYYRLDRKLLRMKADFTGKITEKSLFWYGGLTHYGIELDTVDIAKLNKGVDAADKLPYIGGGLYQQYLDWDLIPSSEAKGGNSNLLRLGLIFDTRDTEASPGKGVFSDAQLIVAPGFIGNKIAYSRLALTFKQYVPILFRKLTFAYRASYQSKLTGSTPFYMLPLVMNMAPASDRDGLGGAKTIRGILRNRIVGEDFVFTNFELRYKVFQKIVFNQNVSGTFAPFFDSGLILKEYKLKTSASPEANTWLNNGESESIHSSYGFGLYGALNENFIVAINYGRTLDKRDGTKGLYINIGYIF